ncbi:MAG TPA: XdhC family protein [Streptosporangiaceae bacterium]|nr:XdhC family protein [Streptosporangiaceae bacterium]
MTSETPMDGWGVMTDAAELARQGEPFALATVVWRQGPSSSRQGSRAIITAAGELRGWIGGACAEPVVIREAQRVISAGEPRLLLLGSAEQFGITGQFGGAVPDGMLVIPISCLSDGALEVYIEPVVPVPHLVVVGHSPMAHTLAQLARTLGWRTDLVDGPDFTADQANEYAMVVVASQGHNDEALLERAIAARPAYLGLVGSRKRGEAVLGYLADRGVPADQLARVTVPAGLDLGSTAHQEIAVSILAELVQLRAAGKLAGPAGAGAGAGAARSAANWPAARGSSASGQAARGPSASGPGLAAETTDPVCGMTVTAGPDGMPLEHDGVTYYFCCAGCRQAFSRDPAAYVKGEARC